MEILIKIIFLFFIFITTPSFSQKISIGEVVIVLDHSRIKKNIENRFLKFKNTPFDKDQINLEIDKISQEIFSLGYFFSKMNFRFTYDEKKKYSLLTIEIILKDRYLFSFKGNGLISRETLLRELHVFIKKYIGVLDKKKFIEVLQKKYRQIGVYSTEITGIEYDRRLGLHRLKNFFFTIQEGHRIRKINFSFIGCSQISQEEIQEIAVDHASKHYYTPEYIQQIRDLIQKKYMENGFLFIAVDRYSISLDHENFEVSLVFTIDEGPRTIIDKIFMGIEDQKLNKKIKENLFNKENFPLNIMEMNKDLLTILKISKEEGYLFSKIHSEKNKIIHYADNSKTASIDITLELGKKTYFNDTIITGNTLTHRRVIERSIDLKKGDLLTAEQIEEIKQSLELKGLFSSIKITPVVVKDEEKKQYLNLLIILEEKEFKTFEIIPGYRTDLGLKLSLKMTYDNFMGMNRSVIISFQGNKRIHNPYRYKKINTKPHFMEYAGHIDYFDPSIGDSRIGLSVITSWKRKKYYGFNADILRTSQIIKRSLTKNLSLLLGHHFEYIKQFDGIDKRDNDLFKISTFSTQINLNFLEKTSNPRTGFFTLLYFEINDPLFRSIHHTNKEINFLKSVFRHTFYIPIGEFTFASSLAFGIEQDLKPSSDKTEFIPILKFFRLNQRDIVRGFDDIEINRVKSGKDITEVMIDDYLLFSVINLELRYLLNDDVLVALFFDAGRLSADSYRPFDLRTSLGISCKLLTPLGTLNLDLGMKLQKEHPEESFGHLHLLIGQF